LSLFSIVDSIPDENACSKPRRAGHALKSREPSGEARRSRMLGLTVGQAQTPRFSADLTWLPVDQDHRDLMKD